MKATEQYVLVVLFIMLHNVVQSFESVDEILYCEHACESYFTMTQFISVKRKFSSFG